MTGRTERFNTVPPVEAEFHTLSLGDGLRTDRVRFTTGVEPVDVSGEVDYPDPRSTEAVTVNLSGPRLLNGHPHFVHPSYRDMALPEHRSIGVEISLPNGLKPEDIEKIAADMAAILLRRAAPDGS